MGKGLAKLLIQKGADIDGKSKYETIQTDTYANDDQIDVARFLIINGANINSQNDDGYTPLHHAAWASNTEMVRLLLSYGAKVDIRDQWGQSALDIAKRGGL